MSPNMRTRTATARPYSARKTRSISAADRRSRADRRARHRCASALQCVVERPDFHRQRRRTGQLFAPGERGIEVGRRDDGETTQMLLALGERTVGGQNVVTG